MTWRRLIEFKPPVIKPKPIQPKVQPEPVKPQTVPLADRNLALRQNNLGGDALKVGLFNRLQNPAENVFNFAPQSPVPAAPQTPPPVDQGKVNGAIASIKDSLDQGITDWDVSHGDLENIENQFENLTPEEANAVYQGLSGDDVENWVQELNGISGEYDQGEKQRLFDTLAGKLNGGNLANFAEKLGLGDESYDIRPGQAPDGDAVLLGRAIAAHAPDNVKADFVNSLKGKLKDHQDAAVAVADVLTSMQDNPALLKQTLGGFSESEIRALVDGAARKTEARHGINNYDPEPLANLLRAASTLQGAGSAELKAKLFSLAADKIKDIRDEVSQFGVYYGGQAEATIRGGLTALIESDTTGVIGNLERTNQGESLKTYVRSMIDTGNRHDQEILGGQIARLLRGNDLSQDQVTYFERTIPGTTGSPYYANAKSLGFYAGAIHAAAEGIKDDRAAQGNLVKNIFGTAAGLLGAREPVSGALANGLTSTVVEAIVSKLDDDGYGFRNALIDATFPKDANGNPYVGVAKSEWQSSFSATAAQYN